MFQRKWIWVIVVLAMAALVLCLALFLPGEPQGTKYDSILNCPGVKWEYQEQGRVTTTIVRGGDLLLNGFFYDISQHLIPTEQMKPQEDWLYQVTFHCPEVVLNVEPIVFRIYENAIQVDDQWYRFPEAISFTAVLEEAKLWYDYALDKFGTE